MKSPVRGTSCRLILTKHMTTDQSCLCLQYQWIRSQNTLKIWINTNFCQLTKHYYFLSFFPQTFLLPCFAFHQYSPQSSQQSSEEWSVSAAALSETVVRLSESLLLKRDTYWHTQAGMCTTTHTNSDSCHCNAPCSNHSVFSSPTSLPLPAVL